MLLRHASTDSTSKDTRLLGPAANARRSSTTVPCTCVTNVAHCCDAPGESVNYKVKRIDHDAMAFTTYFLRIGIPEIAFNHI